MTQKKKKNMYKKASLLFAINWNWLKCAGFFQTVIHKTLWQSSTIVSTDCKWTVYCYLIQKKKKNKNLCNKRHSINVVQWLDTVKP